MYKCNESEYVESLLAAYPVIAWCPWLECDGERWKVALQENEKSWDIRIINFNNVFDLNKIM